LAVQKNFNLVELNLAVYEKNHNWREEILAIEEKLHFWLEEYLADFGGFWRIFGVSAKSAKISCRQNSFP